MLCMLFVFCSLSCRRYRHRLEKHGTLLCHGTVLVVFCFMRDRVMGAAYLVETPRLLSSQTPPPTSRRHPMQMPEPPQLAPLDVEDQRLYSELLPDGRAPHPVSEGVPDHPTEE
ncbi:hypothetical protein ATANTOWER_023886, partial [Ataeniobius toweri]|nr:hypothetical protein [Ataeniobius toweri]